MSWISSALSSVANAVGLGGSDAQAAQAPATQSQDQGINWGGVATNVISGLVGGGAGAAAGYYVGSSSAARRGRRRKRRYPTALQWARFEQANDMLKNHPNGPAMRRQLSWKFFSMYKWI